VETQRLPRLVGRSRATVILSGEIISAQEAYRIGLVNEVVPAAELITRAETILKQIFANAPLAVKYALEAVNKGLETSQTEACHWRLRSSDSVPNGRQERRDQAFLQKARRTIPRTLNLNKRGTIMKTENTTTTENIFFGTESCRSFEFRRRSRRRRNPVRLRR